MSYLNRCVPVCDSPSQDGGADQAWRWRITWRNTRGTVWFMEDGPQVLYYKRHSGLGRLLSANAESERHFIAEAIERAGHVRPTEFVSVT
jgi:hypothetical protein